ncbi:sulfurtransferase [Leptothermofonsia sichuanensis E412]|uniref:sulfurtransferase n=1 Tax=Leptothermofonsia sichuanensis TaxID=2917832 RepID=UPI001CA72F97|nr:sulfurtransferase [Leptothermofonsia sichuanensis]QZZ18900.1 sulfurtransferase [Leptothermofonsia sichuanensis E412]
MADFVVSAAWLYEHLNDPRIAIADCRFSLMHPDQGQAQYRAGHIPGAYYLDLNQDLASPVGKHGGRHPLPEPAKFVKKLEEMGVHSKPPQGPTLIVAYDDSRQAFAARLWWLLRYLGHQQVAVLDGGWTGWIANNYPTTEIIPAMKTGSFFPQLQSQMITDISQVKARKDLPSVALIDSREGERYRGEREPIDPIAGHIPGAANYPWQEATNDRGYLRSEDEQRQRWTGLEEKEEILVYCGSGVTACVNLLSLELAGIKTGKLYPGSWSDWCSYV